MMSQTKNNLFPTPSALEGTQGSASGIVSFCIYLDQLIRRPSLLKLETRMSLRGPSSEPEDITTLSFLLLIRPRSKSGDKKLLTPQPRLRTGFVLESYFVKPETIREACTSVGVAKYGREICLDEKIKMDLIFIGSVAVNPQTGARLGKGEGFAELEYGMLRYMGAIDDSSNASFIWT